MRKVRQAPLEEKLNSSYGETKPALRDLTETSNSNMSELNLATPHRKSILGC